MLLRDLACAAFGWALAAAVWVGATRLQRSLLSDEFGADGLPRGLALLLAAVSTLIALRAVWFRARAAAEADCASALEHARAIGLLALGFGYVLLAPWSGYLPAAFVLIAATTVYYGARPRASLFAISAVGAAFLWWVFAVLLSVSMPAGAWRALLG